MARMPKWVKELKKSEQEKLETIEADLQSSLEIVNFPGEYTAAVSLDWRHKPKMKGDYRWMVLFPGLKEKQVRQLIDSVDYRGVGE